MPKNKMCTRMGVVNRVYRVDRTGRDCNESALAITILCEFCRVSFTGGIYVGQYVGLRGSCHDRWRASGIFIVRDVGPADGRLVGGGLCCCCWRWWCVLCFVCVFLGLVCLVSSCLFSCIK